MSEAGARPLARTPLYDLHRERGARMTAFAGYEMPLHYPPGILAEHRQCRSAAALFDVIETVDRPRLAAALARVFDRGFPRRKCYVEINTGAEPQKSGVLPEAADAFVEACRREYDLPVAGLMCLPPHGADPAPHFDLLRRIAVRNELAELSMGMTADYETAIAHGATHVRVGTAIFGRRAPRGG